MWEYILYKRMGKYEFISQNVCQLVYHGYRYITFNYNEFYLICCVKDGNRNDKRDHSFETKLWHHSLSRVMYCVYFTKTVHQNGVRVYQFRACLLRHHIEAYRLVCKRGPSFRRISDNYPIEITFGEMDDDTKLLLYKRLLLGQWAITR